MITGLKIVSIIKLTFSDSFYNFGLIGTGTRWSPTANL